MSFGHYCFFYIAAASATLPLFTFGRLSFTILLAPFFALFRSLPICFCAAFALSAPCSSASCFPFPIGFSLSGRFLCGSDILLLLRSIPRAPFVTQQVPLPLTSLRLRHILVPPFLCLCALFS